MIRVGLFQSNRDRNIQYSQIQHQNHLSIVNHAVLSVCFCLNRLVYESKVIDTKERNSQAHQLIAAVGFHPSTQPTKTEQFTKLL